MFHFDEIESRFEQAALREVTVQRHADGSIDHAFYRRRAHSCRATAVGAVVSQVARWNANLMAWLKQRPRAELRAASETFVAAE